MKKYLVKYAFDGFGKVVIKAKSKEKADKMFLEGDWHELNEEYEESGENYFVVDTEEL